MKAIEFQTIIENGIIKIPFKYNVLANAKVRIIILTEEPENTGVQKKENLKKIFLKMQEQDIFRKIDNPVKWQKDLRDEWT